MNLNECPDCGASALRQWKDYGGREVACDDCGYREKLEDFLKARGT